MSVPAATKFSALNAMGKFTWSLLLAALVVFSAVDHCKAASLYGKVIEINDGDEITIFNLNRQVRIKLVGVDAPEKNQPFGVLAKQHLSDLILDKQVLVEYTSIGHNSSIVGRVLLNDIDIGAQMIRDGAAWFDPNNKSRLSDSQREVYAQSEQAARSERRGLWQSPDAIAPWEFVKAEENLRLTSATPRSTLSKPAPQQRPFAELTSESLLPTGAALSGSRGQTSSSANDLSWVTNAPEKQSWQRFQATGANFSAIMPSEGKQVTSQVPFGDQTADVNYYVARDGTSIYTLMWMTGPYRGEADTLAIKATLMGFIQGVGQGYESSNNGQSFGCQPTGEKDISTSGFTGREFDLQGCTVPGMVRVYSKASGDQREMYLGAVFYAREDPNVGRFLQAFTIKNAKTRSASKAHQ